MKYITLVLLVAIAACTKSGSPEQALQDYMIGFKPDQSRSFYLDRTSGKLNAVIEAMDEEEFSQFTNTEGLSDLKIKVLHKNCQEAKKCYLTYEVKYKQKSSEEGEFEAESKKIAELVQESGQWKISDVTNVKSFIESKMPIEVSP